MGNSQSNRKITIQEDEVAGVIKVKLFINDYPGFYVK